MIGRKLIPFELVISTSQPSSKLAIHPWIAPWGAEKRVFQPTVDVFFAGGEMRKLLFIALLVSVIAIGLLHFFTPGEFVYHHNTYRRLSYFPIVLGGLCFGLPGGLGLAFLSSIAFIPHVLLFVGHGPEAYLSELTEIVLYLAAGGLVGLISGRQAALREKYRLLSEKLAASYERLQEETGQLIAAEDRLAEAEKLSALGRLSASLAHEVKNPLAAIRGTAEIIGDEFAAEHPKREFVEILFKEINRLQGTVNEVLRYSRRGRGEGEVLPEPFGAVAGHVRALLAGQFTKKGVSLILADEDLGKELLVDGQGFAQVLLNLCLNGLEAAPAGGWVRIGLAKPEGQGWRITVCDNGPGVPEAERELIFAPFHTGRSEGTGLGLFISRKIVASLGGRLAVESGPEGGACFAVSLPEANGTELILEEYL